VPFEPLLYLLLNERAYFYVRFFKGMSGFARTGNNTCTVSMQAKGLGFNGQTLARIRLNMAVRCKTEGLFDTIRV